MPRHLAFVTVLAISGAAYFVIGCVSISMLLNDLGDAEPMIRWIFIGVICIEISVAALIGISLFKRFSRGVFPIAWTDAALIAFAVVFPPALLIFLWWYLGVRKSILPNPGRVPLPPDVPPQL